MVHSMHSDNNDGHGRPTFVPVFDNNTERSDMKGSSSYREVFVFDFIPQGENGEKYHIRMDDHRLEHVRKFIYDDPNVNVNEN